MILRTAAAAIVISAGKCKQPYVNATVIGNAEFKNLVAAIAELDTPLLGESAIAKKNLRTAAEAVVSMIQRLLAVGFTEEDDEWDDATWAVENLAAAIAEPDEMAEACEIIEGYNANYPSTRAREFLKRMEGK